MRGLTGKLKEDGNLTSMMHPLFEMYSPCLETKVILNSKWIGFEIADSIFCKLQKEFVSLAVGSAVLQQPAFCRVKEV